MDITQNICGFDINIWYESNGFTTIVGKDKKLNFFLMKVALLLLKLKNIYVLLPLVKIQIS